MFLSGFPKLFNVWDSWRLAEGGVMVTGRAFCKDFPLRNLSGYASDPCAVTELCSTHF